MPRVACIMHEEFSQLSLSLSLSLTASPPPPALSPPPRRVLFPLRESINSKKLFLCHRLLLLRVLKPPANKSPSNAASIILACSSSFPLYRGFSIRHKNASKRQLIDCEIRATKARTFYKKRYIRRAAGALEKLAVALLMIFTWEGSFS